jgi:hypothetical protein
MDKTIAKALIALMFNKDINNITATEVGGGVVNTKHRGPAGGEWKCKFKFNKGKVKWGTVGGRWRDTEEDIKLSYKIEDGVLHVQEVIGDMVNKGSVKL